MLVFRCVHVIAELVRSRPEFCLEPEVRPGGLRVGIFFRCPRASCHNDPFLICRLNLLIPDSRLSCTELS